MTRGLTRPNRGVISADKSGGDMGDVLNGLEIDWQFQPHCDATEPERD